MGNKIDIKNKTKEQLKEEIKTLQARISQLKELESRYKHTEDTLRQEKHFLSDILFSIQDGISVLDTKMNITYVNPILEKWYAYAMPLVGKKCYEAYHCRKNPCKACPTKKTLQTAQPAHEVAPKRGPHGKIIGWLDLFSFPLLDEKTGQMKGVIEYMRDITKRKKAEQEMEKLHKEVLSSNKRLKRLLLIDPQTNLFNHRYFEEAIVAEFHRAKRNAYPLSLIMLDIDYFKSINDVYGHEFGDLVLRQFAQQLKRMVRRYDIVVRFGGEEFIVISPGIDRQEALTLAQRLLNALSLYNFGDKNNTLKLKLSLAVTSYPEDGVTKEMELVDLADKILDRAKDHGGNRVYSLEDIKKREEIISKEGKEETNLEIFKSKINKLTKKANQNLIEAIFAFAKTIELKDHYTGEHVERTVHYAEEIARELGLSKGQIECVKQAAMLHDLGKIGVSEKILLKKSKLTKKEFESIKRHPHIAADILRPIHALHDVIPLIFYHHERWDGKGYPSGIRGEDIPIGARIIAVADVYQALTTERPYRKAYSKKEAMKIIENASGTQFDPNVVSVFMKILKKKR